MPLELTLLLVQRRDRGFEPRHDELALVAGLAHRSGRASGGGEQPVVGLEERAQIQGGEDREGDSRGRDEDREASGGVPQRASGSRIEGEHEEALAGREGRDHERRLPGPGVFDPARRGPRVEEDRRVDGSGAERPQPPAVAVVEGDVDDVRLERGSLQRLVAGLAAVARERDAPQDLARPALGLLRAPVDGGPEEPQREKVQKQDQEQGDPEEEPRLPPEGARDLDGRRGGRRYGHSARYRAISGSAKNHAPIAPIARKTPNGSRIFPSAPRAIIRAMPTTLPDKEAARTVTRTPAGPRRAPIMPEHLDVAEAHALLARDLLVEEGEQEEASGAERGADQRGQRRPTGGSDREQDPDRDAGQRHEVRQDLELRVDGQERQAGRAEEGAGGEVPPCRRDAEDGDPQERIRELERRIPKADPGAARAAPSAENDPGNDRHVVVRRDRVAAGRAARAGKRDRLPARQAVRDHVQEAADDEPRHPRGDQAEGRERGVRRQARLRPTGSPAYHRPARMSAASAERAPPIATEIGR